MNKTEILLTQQKKRIEELEAPADMEARLGGVLEKQPHKNYRRMGKIFGLAACILLLIMLSQADTLAYFGQRLLGYDQVMNGTLQELNELGKGQIIDKSYTFKKGPTITLDGVMMDDNQLIAFFTIRGEQKQIEQIRLSALDGIRNYEFHSSMGEYNQAKTAIKYQASFAPPYFFEKQLAFKFEWLGTSAGAGKQESGEITFRLDRKKAMGHSLKQHLDRTITIDGRKIRLQSILATPTKTVVQGVIQYPWELAQDQLQGERIRPAAIEMDLLVNGHSIEKQGGGMSTDLKGIRFSQEYDALPAPLETLQIKLTRFTADFDVKKKVDIEKEVQDQAIQVLGQKLIMNKVTESKGCSLLTISSDESLVLTRVYMLIDGKKAALEETVADDYQKNLDGIMHTRTLRFNGTGQKLQLCIERMTFSVECSETIDIPINGE